MSTVEEMRSEFKRQGGTESVGIGVWSVAFQRWITELEAAENRIAESHEIIQGLLDVQNGCPLPKYQRDFDAVNEQARRWIAAYERSRADG